MNKFRFYQDQKVTFWDRVAFDITAETQEEANNIAILMGVNHKVGVDEDPECLEVVNVEHLCDTAVFMELNDNDGFSTLELYVDDTSELIAENGKS